MEKLKKALSKLSPDIDTLDLSDKNIDDLTGLLPLIAKLTNLLEVEFYFFQKSSLVKPSQQ